ncbi:MAG: hypothetical protein J0L95_16420 [Candidatus Accumulibacter sp.]|nr:hypothetical protein [Accumulibacter sp.]
MYCVDHPRDVRGGLRSTLGQFAHFEKRAGWPLWLEELFAAATRARTWEALDELLDKHADRLWGAGLFGGSAVGVAIARVVEARNPQVVLARMDPDIALWVRRLRDLPEPTGEPRRRRMRGG